VRVFVDTNVWLSARFGSGLCADLIDGLIEGGIDVLADPRVVGEFRRIARDKFGVPRDLLDDAMEFFRVHVGIVAEAEAPSAGVPDPDDAWIVAAAIASGATWFVTGDKALLALGRIDAMELLDPRAAYCRLKGLPG
jgi:putative PIN family toxin of toxin-antitoxin system